MRRVCLSSSSAVVGPSSSIILYRRAIASQVPWTSQLPGPEDPKWSLIGKQIITESLKLDTGLTAYLEVHTARRQLESIVRSLGYDASLFTFGGMSVMGLFESGGDVDFVAVSDIEPDYAEASEMVCRISREMRRLGFRSSAIPKARVPVLKADRVSRSLPGTRPHALATHVSFTFARQLTESEEVSFVKKLTEELKAVSVEWVHATLSAIVTFAKTEHAVYAMANVRRHSGVDIPLRLPVDQRNGPELYRYHFDLCLTSTGLRNSRLLGDALRQYEYGRHLLLMLKRWGRSCGIVNTLDGLLASYALTVMCVHFLAKLNVISKVETDRVEDFEQFPQEPPYRPLDPLTAETDTQKLGYLFAAFFEYYSDVFQWQTEVISTTEVSQPLTKAALQWVLHTDATRPPYYHVAIKDPYGLDNIGRNVSLSGAGYIQSAFRLSHENILSSITGDTAEEDGKEAKLGTLVHSIAYRAQRPSMLPTIPFYRSAVAAGGDNQEKPALDSSHQPEQDDARYLLKKMEQGRRQHQVETMGQRTATRSRREKAAEGVTQSMVGWLRSDQ